MLLRTAPLVCAEHGAAAAPIALAASTAINAGRDSKFLTMLDIVPTGSLSGA
jgi:hypothetical protein